MFDDNEPFNYDEEFISTCSKKTEKDTVKPIPTNKRTYPSKSETILEILKPNKKTKTVERKFPGPAGLLNIDIESPVKPYKNDGNPDNDQEEILCSQVTATTFEVGSWHKMWNDFQPLPELYSISFIKKQSKINSFPMQRIPFLSGIIESVESCGKSAVTVLLKDKYDTITASIHGNTLEQYEHQFTIGSVIVLKSVGILTSRKSKICHLIIMKSNILACYCQDERQSLPFQGNLKQYVQEYINLHTKVKNNVNANYNEKPITAENNRTLVINKTNYVICDKSEDTDLLRSIFEDIDTNLLFDDEF